MKPMMSRAVPATLVLAFSAALLAGCGSSVKLDQPPPVESRNPTAGATGAGGVAGAGGGANAGTAPQSQVTTVDLNRGGAAGTDAAAGLGRVVLFDFDSFVVKESYRGMLEGHARRLSAAKGAKVVVEGHTDDRGGREYNLALGQKRAEAVAKSLVLLGAAEGQVEAVSFGKERPVDPGQGEEAWAKNRRAELKDR